jgi:four helix bundle protein
MNHERLKSYELLLDFAKKLPDLLKRLPRGNSYLEDQIKRALSSAILNLAEGNGRWSIKERNRFFDISLASIAEVASVMDIFLAYGYISKITNIESKNHLRRVYSLLRKLKQ